MQGFEIFRGSNAQNAPPLVVRLPEALHYQMCFSSLSAWSITSKVVLQASGFSRNKC